MTNDRVAEGENARDELRQIDDLLADASWSFSESEVEHQITMHADTLPEFVKLLAKHLRKIDEVGKARREAVMDAMEEAAARKKSDG